MTIGERVKLRRQQLGLTQEELAKRIGNSSRASICTVEKDREDLTTTRIAKLAKALETSPSYLMGWTSNPDPAYISDEMLDNAQKGLDKVVGMKDGYYIDPETAKLAQRLYDNHDMRILFDAADGSKPEDIKRAADFLKMLKATNPEG